MNKNNKSKAKRRGNRRANGDTARFAVVTRNPLPFPERHRCVLSYSELNKLTAPAATLTSFYYWQTSLYDPRGSVGGHQPLYFDQLAAIYSRYRVDRVMYDISFDVTDAGTYMSGVSGYGYLAAQKVATFDGDVELLEERPYTNRKAISLYTGPTMMTGTFIPHKVLGVTKQRYMDDDTFSSVVGSNPSNMMFMTPYVWNQSSTAYSVSVRIKLSFDCTFFELATVSKS